MDYVVNVEIASRCDFYSLYLNPVNRIVKNVFKLLLGLSLHGYLNCCKSRYHEQLTSVRFIYGLGILNNYCL